MIAADPLSARQQEIVGVARDLLTREGVEALTLGRVADALGIKPPSLYKHFPSKRVLDGAWHYVAADISAFIYSGFDRFILYAVASPTATGLYDAAYRVIQPIYLVSAVANDAMFRPLALATGEAAKAVMRRYALLILGLTAPVGAFMTIFAAFIVHFLYGDAFTDAAPILGILGWVISIGFISGSIIIPMVAWGQSATYARATAFGAITSVAANVVLIPTMAGVGAAIAATVAKAASGVVARPSFDSRSPVKIVELARPFAIAVAAAALSAYLTGMLVPGHRSPSVCACLRPGSRHRTQPPHVKGSGRDGLVDPRDGFGCRECMHASPEAAAGERRRQIRAEVCLESTTLDSKSVQVPHWW